MMQSNDEKETLVLSEVTQYHLISTESDEETGDNIIFKRIRKIRKSPAQQTRNDPVNWNCECVSRLLVLYFLLMVAFGFAINKMPPIHNSNGIIPESHHPIYSNAAVAAGQYDCSEVGVSILKEGGNAVDAAIGTMLCQGVLEPEFCGIGGGFFMLIYNSSTNSSTFINAREIAPLNSNKSMLNGVEADTTEPLSIAVPGELKGYSYAYHNYGGGVTWKRLFRDAINKSENGFYIQEQLAAQLQKFKGRILKIKSFCDIFCNNERTDVKAVGDLVKNPQLASTLKLVSENGVESFYNSQLTSAMVEDIQADGGILIKKDFTSYHVEELNTLKINLSTGHILVVPPLPSGGPLLSLILSIIDAYHVNNSMYVANPTLYWQRTVESFKHGFGMQTHFGDPNFVSGVNEMVMTMLSSESIKTLKEKIYDNKTFNDPSYYGALPNLSTLFPTSTSHLSVLAPNGDAVSMTSTVNNYFGSFLMSESSGVLFNDEMEDFSTQVEENQTNPNMIEPGKRPQSSMSPCFVLDAKTNEVVYVIGAAGGKQIPTSVAISLLRLLYFGTADFDDAIEDPRLHHQLFPNILHYEKEFDDDIINGLKKIGHKIEVQHPSSHVNGIKNHVSHIHAYSDQRNLAGTGADGW